MERKRFFVCHSGRRAYKTETWKRRIVKAASSANHGMPFFAANPTAEQARGIWWEDLKALTFAYAHSKPPNETRMEIYPDQGSMIKVIGLNEPARFEGRMWAGGVIDEIDNCKPGFWELHARPALDSEYPDGYKPWCALVGVPEENGFLSSLVRKNKGKPDWGVYCWESAEVLAPDVIANAMSELSRRQFDQEYRGIFVPSVGKIYSDYGEKNVCKETIQPHEQIIWTHDQNYTPMSSAIIVKRDGCYYVVGEIVLESAVARQSALEFVERYRNHKNKNVLIYGDPYGKIGEKHGHQSDYSEIENVLLNNGWTFENRVQMSHPAIKDRQNSLRGLICNTYGERRFFVNKELAPITHNGLDTVKTKNGSTFQEDDKNPDHHITTAVGYWADVEHSANGFAEFESLQSFY